MREEEAEEGVRRAQNSRIIKNWQKENLIITMKAEGRGASTGQLFPPFTVTKRYVV